MASVRPVLSPEIANNMIKLYRECLRRAKTFRQQNRELLTIVVQTQFRFHMHETDPIKIQEYKDKAIKGVEDHMEYVIEQKLKKSMKESMKESTNESTNQV